MLVNLALTASNNFAQHLLLHLVIAAAQQKAVRNQQNAQWTFQICSSNIVFVQMNKTAFYQVKKQCPGRFIRLQMVQFNCLKS
jgi:hypothetical protein